MFETRIDNLRQWLCENTKFKPLQNTFDDRYSNEGFLIVPNDIIDFHVSENSRVRASQGLRIYVQYLETDIRTFISNIVYYFGNCGNTELIGMNTRSENVFKQLTEKEMASRSFKFAYIDIVLHDFIKPTICQPC